MNAVEIYVEAAFVLATAGAAMIYPPLALLVAAIFLAALAAIADRRTRTPSPPPEAPQ